MKLPSILFALFVGCLLALIFSPRASSRETGGKASGTPEYKPVRVVKKFPSIRDAKILADASKSDLRADELVLGVVVAGEARAYPINQLTRPTREIINDRLGGQKIAATW